MNELGLIKLLLNNQYFNKYSTYVKDMIKDNRDLLTIFISLDKLQTKYERDISYNELALFILVNCSDKDRDNLSCLLKDIQAVETDNTIFEDVLNTVSQKHSAYELALLALEVSEGRKDYDELVNKTRHLGETPQVSQLEKCIVRKTLTELYENSTTKPGLRWRLGTLNRMLGSLRKGNLGVIFARPESGKTTFLVSELSYFAQQLLERKRDFDGEHVGPILWFNNEEGGEQVLIRIQQGALGLTREDLFADLQGNERKFLENGGGFLTLVDSADIHRKQVEILCEEYQPSCIVFDQLDKVKGFVNEREDLRLGSIYIWARELAKRYCPVIAVSQADASGEGKKWLNMDNVANAKTAKQAEADWILGIGKTHNVVEENMRFLHLSKNKLPGDLDTDPNLRHGRETVRILPEIARYEDI